MVRQKQRALSCAALTKQWADAQDYDGPLLRGADDHRASGLRDFLLDLVVSRRRADRPLLPTSPEAHMLRVMDLVYTQYYEKVPTLRAIAARLEDDDDTRLVHGYRPPADAPAAVIELFRNPAAVIYQSAMEAAMEEAVDYAAGLMIRRIRAMARMLVNHAAAAAVAAAPPDASDGEECFHLAT